MQKSIQSLNSKVIVNQTCNINSAILLEQNEKVQYSSNVTLNSAISKY